MADDASTAAFLLAHHYPEDYGRCYAIGGRRICARCIGLYPVLLAVLASELALRMTAVQPWEPFAIGVLTLPALADWARGRFDPSSGTNPVRTLTGVLLGIALARTVYLNMVAPANWLSVAHFAALAVAAVVVEVLARPHRLKRRSAAEEGTQRPGSGGT